MKQSSSNYSTYSYTIFNWNGGNKFAAESYSVFFFFFTGKKFLHRNFRSASWQNSIPGRDKKIEVEGERIISRHFSNLQQGFSYVPFPFFEGWTIFYSRTCSRVLKSFLRTYESRQRVEILQKSEKNLVILFPSPSPPFFLEKEKVVCKYKSEI